MQKKAHDEIQKPIFAVFLYYGYYNSYPSKEVKDQ